MAMIKEIGKVKVKLTSDI